LAPASQQAVAAVEASRPVAAVVAAAVAARPEAAEVAAAGARPVAEAVAAARARPEAVAAAHAQPVAAAVAACARPAAGAVAPAVLAAAVAAATASPQAASAAPSEAAAEVVGEAAAAVASRPTMVTIYPSQKVVAEEEVGAVAGAASCPSPTVASMGLSHLVGVAAVEAAVVVAQCRSSSSSARSGRPLHQVEAFPVSMARSSRAACH
jgi:hypothetical protein